MANDNVLSVICEERLNGAVNQRLLNDPTYKLASLDSSKAINKLIKTNLTKKQYKRLDKVECAQNLQSAEYGRIAYIQGMKDGFQLAQLLSGKQEPEI